ncbi:MAG: 6-carboxytetrahydropterin synthase [Planctomycetia bacterium]|nr:6-carboxytetrahydropterin synthase [Planctomycetia bacterium]
MASFTIAREMEFCYGHRLLNHPGKCRFLHGHNGRVRIVVAADTLNEQGMVIDFGEIRSTLEKWVDEELDHRTILSQDDPLVEVLQAQGEKVVVLPVPPTAENLARFLSEKGCGMGLNIVAVQFWETPKCCAHYTVDNYRLSSP